MIIREARAADAPSMVELIGQLEFAVEQASLIDRLERLAASGEPVLLAEADGAVVGLLVGGALLAEQAWVNGNVWGGLRGMLLWGGLTGLLAFGSVFPWALLLIPIWLMLWLHAHSRRS